MQIATERIGHLVRLVIDAVNECNLRCLYCHPGEVWRERQIPIPAVRNAFHAAENAGVFEVVLTGGEITMHRDLPQILESTHALTRTASTLITNATRITPEVATAIGRSNLTRVCTSIDGVTNDLHGAARGKNLPKVLRGLSQLCETGKPITVITVVHRDNWERVIELTEYLADQGLAEQHHLCAPSYSGQAREHYPRIALQECEFHAVQRLVDQHHHAMLSRGMYLTFNSQWPATGERTLVVNPGRTITLQQLSEQVKDTLCNIRPNGEFRLQAATWGREMVDNAILGSVYQYAVADLLERAESLLASGRPKQLPRAVEARHKFQIGTRADSSLTERVIGRVKGGAAGVEMVPIVSVDKHWLMDNPAPTTALTRQLRTQPQAYRVATHPTGTVLIFEKARSLITLLRPDEWHTVAASFAA
ncbi:radical SAM protein [Streptomyces sp. NPDC005303]|uniref:radical SAM protein n=1 Tax=Streptomyces sp. NPDC005303 TaxID=3155713 RepID=UPI0033AB6E10